MAFIKAKEGSKYLSMTWVPGSLRDKNVLPESLGTFGSPWLLASGQGSFRHGPEDIPFSGFGHFLHGVSGTVLVMAWPVSILVELAVNAEDGIGTFASMSRDSFAHTVQTHVFHTLLHKGQSVWIPGGYYDCHVSLQDTTVSHTIVVPYINASQVTAICASSRDAVVSAYQRFLRVIEAKAKKPWGQIGNAFRIWLQGALGDLPLRDDMDEPDSDDGTLKAMDNDSAPNDGTIGGS